MKKLNEQNTERVKKIIANQSQGLVDVNDITDTDHLKNDICMDSLDIVEVVFEIENEFNIQIPDSELDGVETVDDLCHKVALYL